MLKVEQPIEQTALPTFRPTTTDRYQWLVHATNAVAVLSTGYALVGLLWYLAHPKPSLLPGLPWDLVVWLLNVPICLFGIIWLAYRIPPIPIPLLDRFALRRPRFHRVLVLLSVLAIAVLFNVLVHL